MINQPHPTYNAVGNLNKEKQTLNNIYINVYETIVIVYFVYLIETANIVRFGKRYCQGFCFR